MSNMDHSRQLVLSAYGRETERFLSHLIHKLAEKKDIPISSISNYVRTKLSFILVRSQVFCVQGNRKPWSKQSFDVQEAEVIQHNGRVREE